jgi:predicted Zn-dependent protease
MARDLPEALEAQATAISRGPAGPAEYMMLAAILNQMNRPEESLAAAHMADRLRARPL